MIAKNIARLNKNRPFYTPSGKIGKSSILLFILVAFIFMPITAILYAYATWFIPLVFIRMLVTIGFAFLIGWLVSRLIIRFGKVRNNLLAVIFSLTCSFIGLYSAWITWSVLVINSGELYGNEHVGITKSVTPMTDLVTMLEHPHMLLWVIKKVNGVGFWSLPFLGGQSISGLFLSVFWIIELILILGLSYVKPLEKSAYPFSESTNQWLNSTTSKRMTFIENLDDFWEVLVSKNEHEKSFIQEKNAFESYTLITLYGTIDIEKYVSIVSYKSVMNGRGEKSFQPKLIGYQITLTESEFLNLNELIADVV